MVQLHVCSAVLARAAAAMACRMALSHRIKCWRRMCGALDTTITTILCRIVCAELGACLGPAGQVPSTAAVDRHGFLLAPGGSGDIAWDDANKDLQRLKKWRVMLGACSGSHVPSHVPSASMLSNRP